MVELDASAVAALEANLDAVRAKLESAQESTFQLTAKTQELASVRVPTITMPQLPGTSRTKLGIDQPPELPGSRPTFAQQPAAPATGQPNLSPVTAATKACAAAFAMVTSAAQAVASAILSLPASSPQPTSPAAPGVPTAPAVPGAAPSYTAPAPPPSAAPKAPAPMNMGALAQAAPKAPAPTHSMSAGMGKADQGAIDFDFLKAIGDQLRDDAVAKMKVIGKAVEGIGEPAKKAGSVVAQAAQQKVTAWQAVGNSIKNAASNLFGFVGGMSGATAGFAGMIAVGMRGTAEMERLAWSLGQVAREVANIFAPAIRAVIAVSERLMDAMRGLTGNQQAVARDFIGAAAGAALFAAAATAIMPRITAISATISKLWGLLAANPIIAVVAAIGALAAGTESGRKAFAGLFDALGPVLAAAVRVGEALAKAFAPVLEAVGSFVSMLVGALAPILNGIAATLNFVADGIGKVSGLFDALTNSVIIAVEVFVALKAAILATAAAKALYAGATAAVAAASGILPAILLAVKGAILAVNAALYANPLIAIAGGVGLLIGGLNGLFNGRREQQQRPEQNRPREQLTNKAGGFEAADQTWKAIQSAFLKNDIPTRQLREAERANEILARIANQNRPQVQTSVGP